MAKRQQEERITLDHGSGGRASQELVEKLFIPGFDNDLVTSMEDSAVLQFGNQRLAFSTDSFVVEPIFFPDSNIGELAVNGTVNDLAMRGARPLYLSVAAILEEGFPISDLRRIVHSMKQSADAAGVRIVTGDTKVVPAGKGDKIFINTSGIGIIDHDFDIRSTNARPGDKVILTGTMADHGITILCQREGLKITGAFVSDSAPLNHLVGAVIDRFGEALHVLRDPTRGGVATTLNEIAVSSRVGIRLLESELPVRDDVRGACELLGMDPLYLANEGKALLFVAGDVADDILALVRQNIYGREAKIIGEVGGAHPGQVVLQTVIGTSRIVDMLHGMVLPRIC